MYGFPTIGFWAKDSLPAKKLDKGAKGRQRIDPAGWAARSPSQGW